MELFTFDRENEKENLINLYGWYHWDDQGL